MITVLFVDCFVCLEFVMFIVVFTVQLDTFIIPFVMNSVVRVFTVVNFVYTSTQPLGCTSQSGLNCQSQAQEGRRR